ncbi:MAG: thiamine pyrophosphokinae catalytic region, partial [Armatimonadetes bacterium]|nr:thiamine pyrophosphokinae catalytic region [Armatimonadota bacterium]
MSGSLRVDRRTKDLCRRLKRGELAVIDHPDLDGTAAYALVEAGVAAVINAA